MISNLQNIGKRIDNLKKVILKENPKDLWIIEQIHPLFIQLVDNNISKEQENHLISLLEQILDKYLWRFNSTFEHKTLTSYLLEGLLPEEEKKKVVAVYGGGFKPPTSGHFDVVKQALKENPEIDEFIILIGGKPRNGITPDESILIWDIYKTYLPFKVEVKYTSAPPIKGIYNYAKEHPDEEVLFVIGAREGNEDDFKDIASRTTSLDKYPNLNLRTIVTQGGASGTAARNAAKVSLDKFRKFVPDQLSDEEVEQVYNIVADKIQENYVLQDLENQYDIDLDLYDNGKHLTLSRISIPKDKRGQGIGSKVMNQITQYADKENKPIYLTPTKDFGASSVNRLEQFYKQFGFKKKDRSDFSTKETMVRMPLNEADPKKGTGKKPKGSGRRLYTDEDPKDTVGVKFSTRQDIVDTLNKTLFKAKSHARQSQIINLIHQRVRAAYGRAKDPAVKKRLKTALDYITKRKEASKKKTQRLKKQKTNESVDFVSLEKTLDGMFEDLGIDINFTRHFKERVIERGLTEEDIIELMEKIYDTYGDEVADLSKDENRVFTHLKRLVDIAAINKGYGEDYLKDLVLKTAYKRNSPREPEFKTNRTSPKLKVTENASYGQHINIIEKIAELTNYMIESGMNIEPLPTMEFIDGDTENAQNFFGKTAYYDPNNQHIVLYTEGRHPKDILRSYAHEMIHHIQYLEDRLHNITTTNTNEDEDLDAIEKEAYVRGNMTFRNWTDSITGNKLEENLNNPNLLEQLSSKKSVNGPFIQFDFYDNGNRIGYTNIRLKKGWNQLHINIFKEFQGKGYSVPMIKKNIEEYGYVVFSEGRIVNPAIFKIIEKFKNDSKYEVLEYPEYGDFVISNKTKSKEELDDILKEIIVRISLNEEKKKKDPFGLNAYAMELARGLEEQESEYKVYLDMDGVLANFDKRFEDISGMKPNEFESKYGRKAFWDLIDEENKVSFWVGIPTMPGASALVDAVKDYNYELLTSPSAKKQSYLGKILWVKNHTGDVFPSKPRINFKKAKEKHLIKPQLSKTDILIDDREDTIERWNTAGGTGIVYKSIGQVLNDLKKLGL